VFVLPSLTAGLSNAALEALSCGFPPVLSLTGGNVDLIEIKEGNPDIRPEDGSVVLESTECFSS
jgi:glycosyltransferase involved in cell wall biosynthesis